MGEIACNHWSSPVTTSYRRAAGRPHVVILLAIQRPGSPAQFPSKIEPFDFNTPPALRRPGLPTVATAFPYVPGQEHAAADSISQREPV